MVDYVCDKCTESKGYDDMCVKCFSAEVSEMTIKQIRAVGSELGVKFCGKTLKADLQSILIRSKVEQITELEDRQCACLLGSNYKDQCDWCFRETLQRMTIKEIRQVGEESGVLFSGKNTKTDLLRTLLDNRVGLAPNEVPKLRVNTKSTKVAVSPLRSNKKNSLTEDKSIQQLLTQYKSVSNLGSAVAKSRNDIDLYSKASVSILESPEVDHIIETQMMAHCASTALRNRAVQFVPDLSHLVNPTNLKNYNVCSKSVNISKGQVVRLFLNDTDGLHRDSGIRAKPYYHCYNQMGNITQAWIDTFPEISEGIRTYRSRADYVQNGDFEQVATQLEDLFDRMKLLDVEGIVTRSKTRAHKTS